MWLKLGDDYFNTDQISVIRPVDDGEQTVIFTSGQSAIDGGFLLDLPTEEVFRAVQNVRLMELAEMMADRDEAPEPEPELSEPEPDETA